MVSQEHWFSCFKTPFNGGLELSDTLRVLRSSPRKARTGFALWRASILTCFLPARTVDNLNAVGQRAEC
jgi:hypothetical protein